MHQYMIFRVDRRYDTIYHTHSRDVSFRGIRQGLSPMFTDPSRYIDRVEREGGVVQVYVGRGRTYLAVPVPAEEGAGPDFAVGIDYVCF